MSPKASFARSAADHALFEAGYPHMVRLVSPHPDDATAAARAEKALGGYDPDISVTWSREVAVRFVLGLAQVGELGIGILSTARDSKEGKAAAKAIADGGEIDEKRARAITTALVSKVNAYEWQGRRAVYILEQLVGGEPVLDAALAYWEKTPGKKWDASSLASDVAYALGFLAMRLPAKKRVAYVQRMQALAKKVEKLAPKNYVGEFLDIASGGEAAVARSIARGRVAGAYWLHFSTDTARIIECSESAAAAWTIDARNIYLGGEPVLANLAKYLRRVPPWRKLQLTEELVPIASKKVDAILKELKKTKALAAAADAALAIRAGKQPKQVAARPVKRPTDAAIEKQFDALTKWLAGELATVRGKQAREKGVLAEAVSRYATIRDSIGEPSTEAVVHFFAADGCGWKKHREPALLLAKPTDAELARWLAVLEEEA